jgi:AraC-like DNA-binding protein
MDAFAEALTGLRLQHAAFARLELAGGEVHAVAPAAQRESTREFASYLVGAGRCILEGADAPGVELGPGAFAVLTRGDAHRLRALSPACSVACARLDIDAFSSPRLLSVLPPLLQVQSTSDLQALQSATLAWAAHADAKSPGADAVLRRMAEALLVQAISLQAGDDPLLHRQFAAASDAIVQRCLALMYRRPEAPWTLPMLAREVHTSRTVLAERFAAIVGEPPISHLTRWRLGAAARLLQQTSWSLARIGEAVGYSSEPAFCRAFRRQFGLPPAAWRRQAAA